MMRIGLLLAVLSVSLFGALSARAGDVVFRVEQAGGLDMNADRLAALLASPGVEVRITYAPVVAVPGWTGRFGLCGISGLSDVCIKKRWRSLYLRGQRIARAPDALRFRVPGWHWFGAMPYRPAGPVRVSLPPLWPGALPVNIDTTLAALSSPDMHRLMDMHLPVPYTGVASWSWQKSDREVAPAWRSEACHPGLSLGEQVQPVVRGHRQSEAYVEWLRALADSDWWAAQIPDVIREQGTQGEVSWRRVQVQREGVALRQLRVGQRRLLSSACPGQSRQEFTWLNDRLLAVIHSETPDIFSEEAACAAEVPRLYEALWWHDVLQRYTQADRQGQWTQEYWHAGDPDCAAPSRTEPDTRALREQAEQWWQRLAPATAMP